MIVHLFYKNYRDLDPVLYAFTGDKQIAKEYGKIRRNLHEIQKPCTKQEYRDLRDKFSNYMIIPHEFKTRTDDNHAGGKARLYVTEQEITHFILHEEEITALLLAVHTINPDIFEDDFRKTLDSLGFSDCYQVLQEEEVSLEQYVGLDPSLNLRIPKLFDGKYTLDELQIFIQHKLDTFFQKRRGE